MYNRALSLGVEVSTSSSSSIVQLSPHQCSVGYFVQVLLQCIGGDHMKGVLGWGASTS